MDSYYANHRLIIDPTYEDITAYAKEYDYDLLGRPLHFVKGFWASHLVDLRYFLEWNPFIIGAVLVACVALTIILLYLWPLCDRLIQHLLMLSYIKQQNFDEGKYASPVEDPDRFAAIYCRALANKLGIASPRYPTPKDLPDFEAVRFVYPQLWLMDKTYGALRMLTLPPVCDLRLEGELGGAIMMALEQRRMLMRHTPVPTENVLPPIPFQETKFVPCLYRIPGPEMELIDAWIDLYRRRCREAAYQNYQWWLGQDKTLPLEAMEMTGKVSRKIRRERAKSEKALLRQRSGTPSKSKIIDVEEPKLTKKFIVYEEPKKTKKKKGGRAKGRGGKQKRPTKQHKKDA